MYFFYISFYFYFLYRNLFLSVSLFKHLSCIYFSNLIFCQLKKLTVYYIYIKKNCIYFLYRCCLCICALHSFSFTYFLIFLSFQNCLLNYTFNCIYFFVFPFTIISIIVVICFLSVFPFKHLSRVYFHNFSFPQLKKIPV